MRIDYYCTYFHKFATLSFYECVKKQIPSLVAGKYTKKVQKVQFYTDFYSKEKGYLFVKGTYSYYPLTVIFPNRKWEVTWIRWRTGQQSEKWGDYFDYPSILPDNGVVYELCDNVPTEFEDYIKGKNLYGFRANFLPSAEIQLLSNFESVGMFSTAFVDVLRTQVYEQLFQLSGRKLTSWWSLTVSDMHPMIKVDGVSYLKIAVKNRLAECYYIGVCWNENVGTDAFISSEDISFKLTDNVPGIQTNTIEKTVKFIKAGTLLFE